MFIQETQSEVGLPHERQFTIACHVSTYSEIGRGKSKKEAKRMAANQMWQRLLNLPIDAEEGADDVRHILSSNNYQSDYCHIQKESFFAIFCTQFFDPFKKL